MPDSKALIHAAGGYLAQHPSEVLRAMKNAVFLRFGVPLDALRYLASQVSGKKAPKDVAIDAVPPGIRVGATIDLMGAEVRASSVVYIERVSVSMTQARIEVRLAEVSLKLLGESDSPVAALLKSGALDLSKPGNLAAYMPKRSPVLVEAEDDRIVIDLMKHPKLAKNARAQRLAGLIGALVGIRSIETDPEHLDVAFQPFPGGVDGAVAAFRDHL